MMFLVLLFAAASATTCPAGEGMGGDGSCAACTIKVNFSDADDDQACTDVTPIADLNCAVGKQVIASLKADQVCGECPAGEAATLAAANTLPGVCTACTAGNFALAGAAACSPHTVAIGDCTTAGDQFIPGTLTADSSCGACPAGEAATKAKDAENGNAAVPAGQCTACVDGNFALAGAEACSPHTVANAAACTTAGQQFIAGTLTSDSSCGECPAGQFAAKYKPAGTDATADPAVGAGTCTACATGKFALAGAEECTTHKDCGDAGVKTAGDETKDNVCKEPASSAAALVFSAVTLFAMLF